MISATSAGSRSLIVPAARLLLAADAETTAEPRGVVAGESGEDDEGDGYQGRHADSSVTSNKAGVAFRQCGENQRRSLRRLEPFPALDADAAVPKARFLV